MVNDVLNLFRWKISTLSLSLSLSLSGQSWVWDLLFPRGRIWCVWGYHVCVRMVYMCGFSLFFIINYCYSFSDDTHTMVFALPVQICFRVCVCVCVWYVCVYIGFVFGWPQLKADIRSFRFCPPQAKKVHLKPAAGEDFGGDFTWFCSFHILFNRV